MVVESQKIARDLDLVEAEAWAELHGGAPADAVAACGVGLAKIGDAVVTSAAAIDVLGFNRVIGLGLLESASQATLDHIMAHYEGANVRRFFVQLHPEALPAELPLWLKERKLRHHNNWVKLVRGVEDIGDVTSDLRVTQIGVEEARTFAGIVSPGFDWPELVQPWVASLVGHPNWRHYLAYDSDTAVATGALFVHGTYGWLDFAGTLPEHRGRGAQKALIAQRIRDARELGVSHLVVETAEETPQRPAPSYRNVIRFGFEVAYVRPNFIFVREDR
jgi:GNAT superfamily N-acetyltransferase